MSNQQVGTVYQQIIADVVESSRVDFEEGGVDEHVLEELRMGWQQKLSQLQVATFPWDPKPEPQPTIANPPTVPSNAGNFNMNTPPQHQNQPGLTMPQMTNQNQNQPRIKSEPGLDDKTPPQHQPFQNPMINLPNATTAQQRAAQHLQNNYGQRAAASINAIQSTAGGSQGQGQGPPQQQQGPPNPQLMHAMQQQQHQHQQMAQMQQQQRAPQGMPQQQQQQGGQRPQTPADQYRAAMARQAAMQQAQLQSQNGGVNGAQTDGAGDEEDVEGLSVIKRFDTNGQEIAMGRVEIDGFIRRKIEAMGQSMEGGGLMLPLHQASTKAKRQRKVVKKAKGVDGLDGIASMDGPDDKEGVKDEDIDEDAINSDLDDPDDGLNDEEDDDDSMGHIMLCMYDKVQRVKNKWKCVMKDGVLTVNGKEYVFHKASGEYEW